MTFEMMFLLGLVLLLGFAASKVSSLLKLPTITTFVIIGILLSPSVLGVFDHFFLKQSEFIVHTVLGVIAFIIGGSIKKETLQSDGSAMAVLLLFQTIITFIVVSLGLYFLLPLFLGNLQTEEGYIILSLFLGVLAATTAPAATLSIIHEYRSKGPLTQALLSMVALDDLLGVILFSWVIALVLFGISLSSFEWIVVLKPIGMILLSFGFGAIFGGVLAYVLSHTQFLHSRIIVSFSMITMSYALAMEYNLEPLVVLVVLGFVTSNYSKAYKMVAKDIELHFEELLFIPFFIVSGAHFDLDSFSKVWPIAIAYVILRIAGKIMGSYLGATVSKSPKEVRKYLGLGLIPQAGVVIGLSLLLEEYKVLESYTPMILSIVITSVAINEIIGPIFTRYALLSSKEVHLKTPIK